MLAPFFKSMCIGSIALLITACGGGGSGSNTSEIAGSAPVLTGQFIDSAVSGIRYVTESRSGTTDSNGQFEYLQGETVSLYIGDQLLGDALGAATITLFDLVEGVNPLVGNTLDTTIRKLNEKRNQDGKFRANFSTVINLAVLLQTLDTDGKPENGIEIRPDVAALFTANNIDFDQHWEEFKLEHGFRKALGEAKSRGLLDSARQVRKSWRAMGHLYKSLGIDSKLRAKSVEAHNYVHSYSYRFTYDEEGKLTRRERDGDGDGTADEADIYSYDANGDQIGYERDYNADGTSDWHHNYTYDADGNLTRVEVYDDVDGVPQQLEIYSYDAYGNQTRFEQFSYDYVLEYLSTKSYDANGRQTHAYHNINAYGWSDVNESWSYNDSGYQILREYSSYGQAKTEAIAFTFNAVGDLLRSERDFDFDGIPDWISTYTHNAQGDVTRVENDRDGNGTIDAVESTAYDTYGNAVRNEWDDDNNGIPNRMYIRNFDAKGNQTRFEIDSDGDGIPESSITSVYEYDTDGNWIRSEVDSDGDGAKDAIRNATYDPDGMLIEITDDYNMDGKPDSIDTWDYAADTDGWWSILGRTLP